MPIAEAIVIEYDDIHVLCVSPCCGKLVLHGSCKGQDFEGERWAHCCDGRYYVKSNEATRRVNKVRPINELEQK